MNIKVVIATHKKYKMPKDDMYLPVQVGREIHKEELGYATDNTGDNISAKNPNYCELTALYWAWKNINSDYLGLSHYRRHFANQQNLIFAVKNKWNNIMLSTTASELLKQYDAILPKKRRYWIETSMSHYEHAHNGDDLKKTGEIIENIYPEYFASFQKIMKKTASHRFNMFIMRRDLLDKYCEWLFSILFQLEREIDISHYSYSEGRVFGYISERLLDVWIDKNQVNYIEIPVIFMEKQNWIKKIYAFLKRKIVGSENVH